jgi:hypothetical protein|eukprot:TRINITY_DN1911_c0_g1_i1.p2 TRINITY_DN1911_c0_g1~~TRINITY_DN1911_c0_g1_i1.p2  ORF type:complete len:147 (+),score=44.90 TRINITY_DN1911_c0_g1_i1:141-581(+)
MLFRRTRSNARSGTRITLAQAILSALFAQVFLGYLKDENGLIFLLRLAQAAVLRREGDARTGKPLAVISAGCAWVLFMRITGAAAALPLFLNFAGNIPPPRLIEVIILDTVAVALQLVLVHVLAGKARVRDNSAPERGREILEMDP